VVVVVGVDAVGILRTVPPDLGISVVHSAVASPVFNREIFVIFFSVAAPVGDFRLIEVTFLTRP
jgi:hypothetical protein